MGAKNAAFDPYAMTLNTLDIHLIESFGDFGFGGGTKAGTPSLATVAIQGELRYGQNTTTRFNDRSIHAPIVIREDAQMDGLVRAEFDVPIRVVHMDPDQHGESRLNLTANLTIDFDRGFSYPLNDESHEPIRRRSPRSKRNWGISLN